MAFLLKHLLVGKDIRWRGVLLFGRRVGTRLSLGRLQLLGMRLLLLSLHVEPHPHFFVGFEVLGVELLLLPRFFLILLKRLLLF